jgi:serine/threonine-protein kinase
VLLAQQRPPGGCRPWPIAHRRLVWVVAGSSTLTLLPFTVPEQTGGVAVDAARAPYVTDSFNNQVVKLAAGVSTPTVLPFTGLKYPEGAAVDSAGNVYVADYGKDRVLKLAAG